MDISLVNTPIKSPPPPIFDFIPTNYQINNTNLLTHPQLYNPLHTQVDPQFDNVVDIIDDGQFDSIFISDDDDEEDQRGRDFVDKCANKDPLSTRDLHELSNNVFLGDNIIDLAQKSLKSSFHVVDGLQDTMLGAKLRFRTLREEPFVQVLHDGALHWLTVTTFGTTTPDEVIIMDSLLSTSGRKAVLNTHVVRQIANLLQPPSSTLVLRIENVQQQPNGFDCGLYAIAFAQYVLKHKS